MSDTGTSRRKELLSELGISLVTLALVGSALGAHRPMLVPILFASVVIVVLVVRKCLPSAPFVTTTLAVGIPVYMCLYALIAIEAFEGDHPGLAYIGCLLPLASFTWSVWRNRTELDHQLRHRRVDARLLARGIAWVVLAGAMISIAGEVALEGKEKTVHAVSLLAGMAAVSIGVSLVIGDLVVLLAVTGHLFKKFVGRMVKRAVPVFSFLLVYIFLTMIFGALYSILDEVTGRPHFALNGTQQPLDLADAIYFSIVTISTIGYGDIVATTSAARTLAALEIIAGVVLFLFAFAEIASYDPEAEQALAGNEATDPNATQTSEGGKS
ncbi:MAG: two pore domain potassium channel family protein [Rhizobiales bacterium]|nr:two pore domain potassium channel family protein [Hyphomicrobiales bacterium]